jgi:hypothetical protein
MALVVVLVLVAMSEREMAESTTLRGREHCRASERGELESITSRVT